MLRTMCKHLNLIVISVMCAMGMHISSAATLAKHYGQRLTHTNAYLPPYAHANFGEKTARSSGSSSSATPENYEPNYSSYVPPASGQVSPQYSRTQQTSKIPLSTLLPQSVIEQFATPPAIAYETIQQQQQHYPQQHPEYQQQDQQQQQQQQSPQIPATIDVSQPDAVANELSMEMPVLMVEEPLAMYLTASQNKTLEAAKLLASTLLEAQQQQDNENDGGGDGDVDSSHAVDADEHAHHSSALPHGVAASSVLNALNRTDIVVVKAHKSAYIIPAPVGAIDGTSRMSARDLYAKRSQLPKAYTINQFVFIIKPERINFLNKLV